MKLPYGKAAYNRTRGNLPELSLVNLFVEANPANDNGVVLQSRKGLSEVANIGTGPVYATEQRDGAFGGDRFTISGGSAYRGTTLLGAVAGTGVGWIAMSDTEVLLGRGTVMYSYNGTNFVAVSFPASANVSKAIYTGGYFIALQSGTGQWYFSAVENGRSWNALDFATAESEPDFLVDIVERDNILVLGGSQSIEMWAPTGDPDLPYSLVQNRSFEQGVIAIGCMVTKDNSIFWIGRDGLTYRMSDVPQAISDDGIVERSKASTSHRLFVLDDERHPFLCQRHDNSTMAYDIATGEWCEFQSYGRSNFRCGPGFGDDETGKIWAFSGYVDAGGVFERRFRAGANLDTPLIVNRLSLTCEVGTTSYLSGDYEDPIIEMRHSRDGGNLWTDWEQVTLGEAGGYRQFPSYRALGMFDHPGILCEFRMTAPVSFRLSDVLINNPGGGRSR